MTAFGLPPAKGLRLNIWVRLPCGHFAYLPSPSPIAMPEAVWSHMSECRGIAPGRCDLLLPQSGKVAPGAPNLSATP